MMLVRIEIGDDFVYETELHTDFNPDVYGTMLRMANDYARSLHKSLVDDGGVVIDTSEDDTVLKAMEQGIGTSEADPE